MKLIAVATQADADVCNALVPPVPGCNAGGGIHIVIPPDFAARIAAGQEVPGCSYAHLEADGSLIVSDRVVAQIAVPAVVNALSAPQQAEAAALNAKLATAVVVSSAQVAQQQQDITT